MRAWGLLLLVASTARADDHPFEASAFVGVGTFSDDSELGNSWAPEQVPNTSPLVGARLGWVALPRLVGPLDGVHLAATLEGEFSLATAFTGDATSGLMTDRTRASYFAPVLGWRGHAMLQLAGLGRITPHLLVGGGGETVASSSPYMTKETDSVFYWGPGVSVGLSDRWRVRLDLRHGVMAARDDGMTSTLEAQLGLAARFGGTTRHPVIVVEPTKEPVVEPERIDPPVVVSDVDGDGLVGAADHCPEAAEDFDKWADDDGCPELDNDEDGIEDARDVCPLEPETKNGVTDADGCPDAIPDDVTRALAAGAKLRFEANRARVTPAAQATLRPLYQLLVAHPEIKIRIVGKPDKASGTDLAKRRADAVKWWLVDQGVTEGRIAISLGEVGTPAIELVLRAE